MERQIELSYNDLKKDMIKELNRLGEKGLYERATLATSVNDKVYVRRIRFIADGLNLYCYTFRSRKYEQVLENPNVAVAVGFVQVEGTATDKGHPLDPKNERFIQVFKETQPEFYEGYKVAFEKNEEMFLIEVVPKRVALYKYANPEAGVEQGLYLLNVEKGSAHRIIDMTKLQEDHKDAPAYWENIV